MQNTLPDDICALILDMDGVLWKGDSPIGNLPSIFARIAEKKLKYILATNNATKTPEQYQDKLASFGVAIDSNQVITSAQAAAFLIKSHFPTGGPVFIIGEAGLENSMKDSGFFFSEKDPVVVVVGMDRELNYEKLRKAALFIRAGVPFYGTNPDKTFPSPQGIVPGAGATLALLETSTNVKPVIAGKPYPYMFEQAIKRMSVPANSTISIGDRLETDILGGKNAGCRTALVLSGVTMLEDISASEIKPDIVAKNLTELVA